MTTTDTTDLLDHAAARAARAREDDQFVMHVSGALEAAGFDSDARAVRSWAAAADDAATAHERLLDAVRGLLGLPDVELTTERVRAVLGDALRA